MDNADILILVLMFINVLLIFNNIRCAVKERKKIDDKIKLAKERKEILAKLIGSDYTNG